MRLAPQAAKLGNVLISNAERGQAFRKHLGVELRVRPRASDGSYVDYQGDFSHMQQGNEFWNRPGRVTDSVKRIRHFLPCRPTASHVASRLGGTIIHNVFKSASRLLQSLTPAACSRIDDSGALRDLEPT